MLITSYKHEGVDDKGNVPDGGQVITNGMVRFLNENDFYLTVGIPLTQEGTVEGICIQFENKKQMQQYIRALKELTEKFEDGATSGSYFIPEFEHDEEVI